MLKAALHRWLVQPILRQLTQGVTPPKIAQAVSWGVTLGIFPILGSNTLLTLIVGVPMKLNQPVLQAFKTVSYPLQWSLLLGFYRAGEWLFGAPHVSIHLPTAMQLFFEQPGTFFHDYGMTALYGIVAWAMVAPLILLVLYLVTKPVVERLASWRRTEPVTASS